jgi:hypothetical protein
VLIRIGLNLYLTTKVDRWQFLSILLRKKNIVAFHIFVRRRWVHSALLCVFIENVSTQQLSILRIMSLAPFFLLVTMKIFIRRHIPEMWHFWQYIVKNPELKLIFLCLHIRWINLTNTVIIVYNITWRSYKYRQKRQSHISIHVYVIKWVNE